MVAGSGGGEAVRGSKRRGGKETSGIDAKRTKRSNEMWIKDGNLPTGQEPLPHNQE